MKLHPYALLLGFIIAVMVFVALRHPLIALFALVLSTLGLDILFKQRLDKDEDKKE